MMKLQKVPKLNIEEISLKNSVKYRIRYTSDGKKEVVYFTTLSEAEMFRAEYMKELKEHPEVLFTPKEKCLFGIFKHKCKEYGVDIETVFSQLDRIFVKDRKHTPILLSECISRFCEYQKNRGIRETTAKAYEPYFKKLLVIFEGVYISDITTTQLKLFVLEGKCQEHKLKALKVLFNYCKQYDIISENVALNIKLDKKMKSEATPEVLTIDDVKNLFENIPPNAVPYFALLCFGAMRPEELLCSKSKSKRCLHWEDINISEGIIKVPGIVSKTRKIRNITVFPENLKQLLQMTPLEERKGPIIKMSHKSLSRIKKGLAIKLSQNVLRHSYASYGSTKHGMQETALAMGHGRGLAILDRHYLSIVSKQSAIEYFNISPNTINLRKK